MTIGELAQLFNEHFGIGAKLRVVRCAAGRARCTGAIPNLRWTPTSPNIPYAFTPLVYLATGLIDEGGVNNGVGTDRPFEYAGGYGFDATAFARTLNARGVPGARFEPLDWVPRTRLLGRKDPGRRADSRRRSARVSQRSHRGRTARGGARARQLHIATPQSSTAIGARTPCASRLLGGASVDAIVASWESGLSSYRAIRERYLLY